MGMCDEWIYMLLLVNMCFVISWGISSVGRASALREEGHWLDFCILQLITLALSPGGRPHIFASRVGGVLGYILSCIGFTRTINLFLDNN